MYEDLVEKLVEVDEAAVATRKASPVEKLKSFHKKILNTKLRLSKYSGEKWYKFFILPAGEIIPVYFAHDVTIEDAGVDYTEAYKAGIVRGLIDPNTNSLNVEALRLSSQQISKLVQLYVEYKPTSAVLEVDSLLGTMYEDITSADQLDYLLRYGKDDIDEAAVSTKASPTKLMKSFYRKVLNGKLKPSTWTNEPWYKFWILKDGTHIPVELSHGKTVAAAMPGDSTADLYQDLLDDGAMVGSIRTDEGDLEVQTGKSNFTEQQIAKLRQFYIEYKPTSVYVDTAKQHFSKAVGSSAELDYALEYGLDESIKLTENIALLRKYQSKWQIKFPREEDFKDLEGRWFEDKTFGEVVDRLKALPPNKDVIFRSVDEGIESFSHVDFKIRELVKSFNQKGFRTLSSCSGHPDKPHALSTEITFLLGEVKAGQLKKFIEKLNLNLNWVFIRKHPRADVYSLQLEQGFYGDNTLDSNEENSNLAHADISTINKSLDESIEEAVKTPVYLYHGTFRPLLDKIKSEGLKTAGTEKNYSDSEEGWIYLAKNAEEAEAFAEVSETVPDEWVDQIVVLRIETAKLDKSKIVEDPNVRDTEVMTFQYPKDIPSDAFTLVESIDEANWGCEEAGWIHSNGEREELLDYLPGDHDKDAYRKIHPGKDIPKMMISRFPAEYKKYLSQGHIRYIQTHRGFNVEVGKKPTESQMRAIQKGIKENESGEFYFSVYVLDRKLGGGDTWEEFREVCAKLP